MSLKRAFGGRSYKNLSADPVQPKGLAQKIEDLTARRIEHMHEMLDAAESEIVDHPVTPDRFFFMRPSGFPYCGLRKLLTAPSVLENGQLSELAGGYFTSVGTAAHTVFQSHVGRLGEMIGDWKCPACKKVTKFKVFKLCECGAKPEYEELEVFYRNTTVGHLDGLVKLKERCPKTGKPRYLVIDYKTATSRAITAGQKPNQDTFPYAYNVQQIKRYVVLMELCFNVKVEGWMLIYLNRDVPLGRKNRVIIYREVKAREKRELVAGLDEWVETHRKVLAAYKPEHFDEIKDRKLCASLEDYQKNWASPYQPCPVLPQCFDQKRLERRIQKTLGHDVFPLINMSDKKLQLKLDMQPIKKEQLSCNDEDSSPPF